MHNHYGGNLYNRFAYSYSIMPAIFVKSKLISVDNRDLIKLKVNIILCIINLGRTSKYN